MRDPAFVKSRPTARMSPLAGFAGILLLALGAGAEPPTAQATPRFVYASGAQGVGYYANPGTATRARTAPAPRAAARGTSVGPGVRDWSTGRRGRLHKPWLQPR